MNLKYEGISTWMFKIIAVWKLSICWEHNIHQMKATLVRKRKGLHMGSWISNRFCTNEDLREVHLHTPSKFFKILKKKFGKFLDIRKVITQWSCAIDMMKYRYSGKFLMKNIELLIFGLCTIILGREEGRAEKLTKKISKEMTIHKNWATFQTWNAYEMKLHSMLYKIIYQWNFQGNHVKNTAHFCKGMLFSGQKNYLIFQAFTITMVWKHR